MNPENFVSPLTICLMITVLTACAGFYRWTILCTAVTSVFIGLVSGYWYLGGFTSLVLLALHSGSATLHNFLIVVNFLPPFEWQDCPEFWPNAAFLALFVCELWGIVWLIASLPK